MAIATITTPPLTNLPATGGNSNTTTKIILWGLGLLVAGYLVNKYVYPFFPKKKDDSEK